MTETTGAIMSRDEVLELVRSQLAEILEIDMAEISESSSFADDLNADSLALIELVEALEEELSDRRRVPNRRRGSRGPPHGARRRRLREREGRGGLSNPTPGPPSGSEKLLRAACGVPRRRRTVAPGAVPPLLLRRVAWTTFQRAARAAGGRRVSASLSPTTSTAPFPTSPKATSRGSACLGREHRGSRPRGRPTRRRRGGAARQRRGDLRRPRQGRRSSPTASRRSSPRVFLSSGLAGATTFRHRPARGPDRRHRGEGRLGGPEEPVAGAGGAPWSRPAGLQGDRHRARTRQDVLR